jgi:hypothetical protein
MGAHRVNNSITEMMQIGDVVASQHLLASTVIHIAQGQHDIVLVMYS